LIPGVAETSRLNGDAVFNFSPRLFVSYSRQDAEFVGRLEQSLRLKGFSVFRDTSDISPGDNFVSTIVNQIRKSTALITVISDGYNKSLWAKAELHSALTLKKFTIPIVLSEQALSRLEEPLRRMLQNTNYVLANPQAIDPLALDGFAVQLARARQRHRTEILRRALPIVTILAMLGGAVWWGVGSLNSVDRMHRRDAVLAEVVNARRAIEHDRIAQLASAISGDREALGEILYLSQDPAASDVARINALSLESELRRGQKAYRWYPRNLDLNQVRLEGITLANVSFLGGKWSNVRIDDTTIAGAFWSKDNETALSGMQFKNVAFYGSEFEAVNVVDVLFVNAKFRGSTIDTTNFAKVRFVTDTPATEGTPIITPYFTVFENSTLISRREAPAPGIMDLTAVGDDITFDGVVFKNCRLEGWFRPEWFRNSSFEDCVLPESLSKDKLVKAGNTVD
jgi:uncharacterized protein YjbI with pentapeptide repeats